MDEQRPWAEAVAVRGTDIVHVGDDEGAHAFVGTDGPFFSYGGAFEGSVEITRHQIDEIIADRPFLMMGQGGHGGWANTKALEMSGIVADRPDPVDAWGRDEHGDLTGEVMTSPAAWWMVKELDIIRKERVLGSAEKILAIASRNGITTSFEAATFEGSAAGVFSAVHELEQTGRLNVRIVAGAMIQRDDNVRGALAELREFGPEYSSDLFNVDYMKIHGDGSPDNRTAGMLDPYPGTDGRGFLALEPQQLEEVLLEVTGMRYDVHTHTIGDRAIRWALDGFAAGHHDVRLDTGHTTFLHPDDAPRSRELDVGADALVALGYPLPSTMAVISDEQRRGAPPREGRGHDDGRPRGPRGGDRLGSAPADPLQLLRRPRPVDARRRRIVPVAVLPCRALGWPPGPVYRVRMQSLLDFVRATVTSPRGLPDGSRALEDRVRDLDDRMETLDVLTWVLVPAALIVGVDSFRHLVRAQPGASTSRLLVRSTICTWSLTAIAMTKLWHARAQEHTALMKEQLALRDQVDRSMLRLP